ncbi:MAG: tetratricopeptide repeat protein [Burkholderiaceae bacterium]
MFQTSPTKAFSSGRGPRRDWRLPVALATVCAIAVFGASLRHWNGDVVDTRERRADPRSAPSAHAAEARADEVRVRFEQAVVMLHARQYEHAATALHRVIELDPELPEAHVNMGYAMLGLERFKAAADFFAEATERRPGQANAYYGLAVALEAQGDVAGALGAMRTFVHLSPPDDPFVRKARAALWEWQAAREQASAGAARDRR